MSDNTQSRPTIVLLVPDGIGVRNYLYTHLLEYLKDARVILLHQLPDEIIEEVAQLHPDSFTAVRLPEIKENITNDLLRKLCMFATLHRNAGIAQNPSIKRNWLFFTLLKGRKKFYYRSIDLLAGIIARWPSLFEKLEGHLFKRMMHSDASDILKKMLNGIKPSLIMCTHQRSIEAGYVMTAARSMNIKTCTVIFSWDNLPKSRITFKSDYYLVWSKYMEAELEQFYPKIKSTQITITGTPQFDNYYSSKGLWPSSKFCEFFQIPAGKTAICFSGNEPSFPSDHLYLRDVLEELQTSAMPNKPIVLVRPSPNDHTGRLEQVAEKFPGLAIVAKPLWKRIGDRDWESNYPTPADGEVLLNIVYHCACVINFGSTMGLDFAHYNKPALYINYNHPDCDWFDLIYGYEQEHFKTLKGLNAVCFIDHRHQFAPAIEAAIMAPETIAPDRLKWKERITDNIENASAKVANALLNLANS